MTEIDESKGPSHQDVSDLVVRLIGSEWPTSDAERRAWFRTYGLPDSDGVGRQSKNGDGDSFDAPIGLEWPGCGFGWHRFRDEFVGVRWFVWGGLARNDVRARAAGLKARLTEQLGTPVDAVDEEPRTQLGSTSLWKSGSRTVDMYFHTGIHHRRDGTTVDGPAVVQLHVDHTQRSEAKDAVAYKNQAVARRPQPRV